jgi:hypothetical protein
VPHLGDLFFFWDFIVSEPRMWISVIDIANSHA